MTETGLINGEISVSGEALTGLAFRLLCLTTKYSKPLDYTEAKLDGCKKVLLKWWSKAERTEDGVDVEFLEALCDDMNTPKALAVLHKFYARKEYGRLFAAMNFLGLLPNSNPRSIQDLEQKMPLEELAKSSLISIPL